MAKRKDRDGIYQRKDRPGFWGSYVDPDGVRHREKLNGAHTLTQAREALSRLERKAEKDHALEVKDVSDISTSDLLERFRRYQKIHLRPSTYERLEQHHLHTESQPACTGKSNHKERCFEIH